MNELPRPSRPNPELASTPVSTFETVASLSAHFAGVRGLALALVDGLSDADASVQSMPDASPSKWHLAHTTWFFETFVLRDFVRGYRPFDQRFAFLYNSYYEAEGGRIARPSRGLLTRPSLDEIRAYRSHVDAAIVQALDDLPEPARELVEFGCHHEEQHQELLLTDMLHLFAQNPLLPAAWPPARPRGAQAGELRGSRVAKGRSTSVTTALDLRTTARARATRSGWRRTRLRIG